MPESPAPPPADDASLRLEHGVFESRYRVLRTLGDGGMGEVVLAEHLSLGKRVAIKIMHPQYRGDTSTEQRFILETRAAARIHHDNVVGISDFGRTADGRMFFVMEYLEGEDLSRTLKREGPLPWRRVLHMARQVMRAIGEAHSRGVIHRDIKPGNCFRVTRDGDPDFIKVLDFGLAKLVEPRDLQNSPQTITGVMLGTPGYMAPEILAGHRPDPRADLYSIAALMLRLLTGKLRDLGGLAALSEAAGIPAPLVKMLRKALQDDPAERFQSAAAMEEALDYVLLASTRPVTGNRLQPPARGASQPDPAARPVTGGSHKRPVTGGSHAPPADDEPVERRTQFLHSGALQTGRAPTQPVLGGRPFVARGPSRSRVVLVSLLVGALLGVGAAVWMHLSQETASPEAPRERGGAGRREPGAAPGPAAAREPGR